MTRPDTNQQEIVDTLRKAGVMCWLIGEPCDLLTFHRNRWQTLEIKRPKAYADKRQVKQKEFLAITGTPVVRTALEALAVVTLR